MTQLSMVDMYREDIEEIEAVTNYLVSFPCFNSVVTCI